MTTTTVIKQRKIILTCLSLDCPERKSICCGAISTPISGDEGTGYFACSNCMKEYIGGECKTTKQSLPKGEIKKCTCVYGKDGSQIGMCLRCANLEFKGAEKEWRRIVKMLKKLYKRRGKPYWFFNENDLKELDKGKI